MGPSPADRELLRRVVALLGESDDPREGAILMERLLAAVAGGPLTVFWATALSPVPPTSFQQAVEEVEASAAWRPEVAAVSCSISSQNSRSPLF